jgi:ADP-ribosylglycohydrolase
MEWYHLPIPDLKAPRADFERRWTYSGHVLRRTLRAGGRVLIHCRGGRGRTGLVAARLLVEFGCSPPEAIRQVRAARQGAIETSEQEQYVLNRAAPVKDDGHADRVLGCLFAGAVGDAFGYALEFMRLEEIRRRYGHEGLTEPVLSDGSLIVSDDTQMTLFTAAGLASALRLGQPTDRSVIDEIRKAYLSWLQTQTDKAPTESTGCNLSRYHELWRRRAPGNTCLSALETGGTGSIDRPINNSKGCGGVMRVAPLGLVASIDAERAFGLAAEAAALTHGHPSGYLSAATMASLVRELVGGASLQTALDRSLARLSRADGHEETSAALDHASRVAGTGKFGSVAAKALGEGWVGEEALAIALFAATCAASFGGMLQVAANHDGDSDSTASIAAQIWGASRGLSEIPHRWIRRLDVFDPICDVATRLLQVSAL